MFVQIVLLYINKDKKRLRRQKKVSDLLEEIIEVRLKTNSNQIMLTSYMRHREQTFIVFFFFWTSGYGNQSVSFSPVVFTLMAYDDNNNDDSDDDRSM